MPTTSPTTLLAALITPTQAASVAPRNASALAHDVFSRQLAEQREVRSREPERSTPPEKAKPAPPPTRPAAETAAKPATGPHKADKADKADRSDKANKPATDKSGETQAESTTEAADAGAADASRDQGQDDAKPHDEAAPIMLPDVALQDMLAQRGAKVAEAAGDAASGPALRATRQNAAALRGGVAQEGHAATTARAGAAAAAETAQTAKAEGTAALWQQAHVASLLGGGAVAAQPGLKAAAIESTAATPGASSALAGVSQPSASIAKAGAVPSVPLATPVTSPDFKAALGVQVSLLARAGVQQAELQLNPAELGPVSVQIVLDGRHAQVNFGADSAQTRQLIESGMPELAASLREAGLTLTGGGVSQQGRQRDESGAQAQDGRQHAASGEREGQEAPVARRIVRVAAGGVDLYA